MVNSEEDLILIKNIKNNIDADESIKKLVIKHSGIFYDKISDFMNHPYFGNTSGVTKEDILSEKAFIIYKAAISFDENKNIKFSTWVGNSTFYYLHHLYNDNKNETLVEEMPEINSFEEENVEERLFDSQEKLDKIKDYINSLEDLRIKEIFNLRYFSRTNGHLMQWEKIGSKIGLSHEGVRLLHNKTIKELKTKLCKN